MDCSFTSLPGLQSGQVVSVISQIREPDSCTSETWQVSGLYIVRYLLNGSKLSCETKITRLWTPRIGWVNGYPSSEVEGGGAIVITATGVTHLLALLLGYLWISLCRPGSGYLSPDMSTHFWTLGQLEETLCSVHDMNQAVRQYIMRISGFRLAPD